MGQARIPSWARAKLPAACLCDAHDSRPEGQTWGQGRAGGGVLFSLSRATRSLLLYRLRSEHSLSCFSTKHSEQTLDEATRLRLPVPGLPSSADDRAVLPGDQGDLCRDNIQSSGQRMTDTKAGFAGPAGRVWCGAAPWSPCLEHLRRTLPGH